MPFNRTKYIFLFLFLFSISLSVRGQSEQKIIYYKFKLSDLSQVIGHITFKNDNVVQIKTISGDELRINEKDILDISPVSQSKLMELKKTNTSIVVDTVKVDTSKIIRFSLKDGSVLIGKILEEDSSFISVALLSGSQIKINKTTISGREIVTNRVEKGEYWPDDPNKTRLFFAPTGRGLKNGDGYFSVYEIFFPMLAFGVGDYITLAGGITLFPGSSSQAIYFAPKITPYQDDDFAISAGDFFVAVPNHGDNINILYSVGTFTKNNFSFTAGAGLETSEMSPIFLLGAEIQTSSHAKIISENWFFFNSDLKFLSLGIRFFGTHIAADFAFIYPLAQNTDPSLFPWIGFAYNF